MNVIVPVEQSQIFSLRKHGFDYEDMVIDAEIVLDWFQERLNITYDLSWLPSKKQYRLELIRNNVDKSMIETDRCVVTAIRNMIGRVLPLLEAGTLSFNPE